MSTADITACNSTFSPVSKVTLKACLIWGLGAFFYFYEFMLQISPSVMVPDLMRAYNVHAEAVGTLSAFYFYTYALMQIPVGLLIDKFGPRRLLAISALTCSLGCLLFAKAQTLGVAQAGRALMGLGSAFALVGGLKLTSLWFPAKRFALFAGLLVTIGMLGAATGQAPLAKVVEIIGWRHAMQGFAIIGVVLAFVIWCVIHDESQMKLARAQQTEKIGLIAGLLRVIKDRQTWLASIYASLMFVPTLAFGELWGVPYLMERFLEVNRPHAAGIISFIFFGWMLGAPLFGWVSDKLHRRNLPMYFGTLATMLSMYLILNLTQLHLFGVGVLLFCLGVFSSSFVLAFSVVRENHPFILGGTAMGFINILNTLGGAIGQPVVGHILDKQWTGEMAGGVRVFTLDAYYSALKALPWGLLIALLLLPLVKETYCKFREKAVSK